MRPIVFFAVSTTLCSVLSGCGSILSGAGPSLHAVTWTTADDQYKVVDLSAETILPYMRAPDSQPVRTVSATKIPDIKLIPGDVLRIMIADSTQEGALFAPLAAGGTVFDKVRVDAKGMISLPYAGHLKVGRHTPTDVEDLIKKKLHRVTTDPQVHVELVADLSGSVLVAGAVKTPGRFSALQGPLTLLDAINQAGGPLYEPHLIRVTVRDGTDEAKTFNYEELLNGKNQLVMPNSEIILERDRKRFVAMGAVTQPGLHDLPSSNPSLLEVLGVAGGLREDSADPSGVFVFRLNEPVERNPDSKKVDSEDEQKKNTATVFRLNMKDPASVFLAREFLVQPEDAIYVTNAAVYEWQKIISPIVQVMVLGRTVNRGF